MESPASRDVAQKSSGSGNPGSAQRVRGDKDIEFAAAQRARRWSAICVAGLAVIYGYLLIYHYHHQTKAPGNLEDFPTFYIASQYALHHKDIYTAGTNPKMMYVYPPLIAFLYSPLTVMSVKHAAHVSLLLNTLMLLGASLLAARAVLVRLDALRPAAVVAVALLVSILSQNEMRAELLKGETDALMLLMFALGFYWLDRRPAWGGIALALALNIKYLPVVVVPYLVLRRRWTMLAAMIAGSVFFALIPAVILGWNENLRCLHVSLAGLWRWVGIDAPPGAIKIHNIADDLSVSVTSVLARVLGPHGFSNSRVMMLATAVGVVAVALVAWMYRRHRFPLLRWPKATEQAAPPFSGLAALEWAGLIVVALVFSPDTNMRHLVLAVLVNTLAAAIVLTPRANISRAPALIGTILIFLGFIMPFGRTGTFVLRTFYYYYGIPCLGLLGGYFLVLWTSLHYVRQNRDGGGDMNGRA